MFKILCILDKKHFYFPFVREQNWRPAQQATRAGRHYPGLSGESRAHRSHLLHRRRDPGRVHRGGGNGGVLDGDREDGVGWDDAKHSVERLTKSAKYSKKDDKNSDRGDSSVCPSSAV